MVRNLFENLVNDGYNFFTGVPDSGLKPFINDIIESDLPDKRPLEIRDTKEFIDIAQRVREGLRAGHSYE